MTPREMLHANAEALEADQPLLADGLRSIPDEMIGKLEVLDLPLADTKRLQEFIDHILGIGDADAIILLGLGTPDMMLAIREALPSKTALIVLEPGLELSLRMMISADLGETFEQAYTGLIAAPDDYELQRQIENLVASWGLAEIQMVVNPMRPLGDELTQLAVALISNAVENVQVAAANVAHFGAQIIENVGRNIASAGKSGDANVLANAWQGKPAIVVGAGPGLDSDIATLKANAGKAVIIAVDAAAKALKDAGVPIDLVVTLDVINQKASFLESLGSDTKLVALLGAHPDMTAHDASRLIYVSDTHPLSEWCAKILNLPIFPAMGNVAHLAYVMAKGAGCERVCFVGVDYALGDSDQLYAMASGRGDEEVSAELKAKLVAGMSYGGEEVKTLPNMVGYAHTLAGFVAQSQGNIFNANTKALRVLGVAHKPLSEFFSEFGVDVPRPLISGELPQIDAGRAELLIKEMGPLENELRTYAADASTFAEDADRIRNEVGEGKMASMDAIKSLSEGAGLFARHKGVIDMVEPLQPAVSFEIARLTRQLSAIDNPMERAQAQLFTLSGPAAGGAQVAEAIADRLREAIQAS